jgi:hypothetical protein
MNQNPLQSAAPGVTIAGSGTSRTKETPTMLYLEDIADEVYEDCLLAGQDDAEEGKLFSVRRAQSEATRILAQTGISKANQDLLLEDAVAAYEYGWRQAA